MTKVGDLVVYEGYPNLFAGMIAVFQRLLGRKRNHKVYHVGLVVQNTNKFLHSLYGKGVIYGNTKDTCKGKYTLSLVNPLTTEELAAFREFQKEHVGKHYETNLGEFVSSLIDCFSPQERNVKRFFCSELVIEYFISIGRLPKFPASNEYTPQDVINTNLWNR